MDLALCLFSISVTSTNKVWLVLCAQLARQAAMLCPVAEIRANPEFNVLFDERVNIARLASLGIFFSEDGQLDTEST